MLSMLLSPLMHESSMDGRDRSLARGVLRRALPSAWLTLKQSKNVVRFVEVALWVYGEMGKITCLLRLWGMDY